ncbi:unnamed protein product [Strongylus vulgaris]|uniref:Endonuclease/exonuclease/phosphatase domain-containing protein n=1 Tax=Strongylus vulgaris TaxID=40348 RepID=A0A3P7J359_STRVU|nr:unnamed protein product [Strongylus vulgaris]
MAIFMKKEHRRWTCESPNGTTHEEIDHILNSRRWCLLKVSVVPSFSSVSDHCLLQAKMLQPSVGKELLDYRKLLTALLRRDLHILPLKNGIDYEEVPL